MRRGEADTATSCGEEGDTGLDELEATCPGTSATATMGTAGVAIVAVPTGEAGGEVLREAGRLRAASGTAAVAGEEIIRLGMAAGEETSRLGFAPSPLTSSVKRWPHPGSLAAAAGMPRAGRPGAFGKSTEPGALGSSTEPGVGKTAEPGGDVCGVAWPCSTRPVATGERAGQGAVGSAWAAAERAAFSM